MWRQLPKVKVRYETLFYGDLRDGDGQCGAAGTGQWA